ncbi:MAG: hypothetical protein M9894_05325 [Planctomycetes bacterium]|nr:hypothetical protein [Planctomycetota bacterium]
MAADERYRKLLGIEPSGETPTHYELLVIDRSVTDLTVIEESYKSQMKKLQQVKTSKDKGFLEFLKEELRTARLTLTNAERRKAYDESLVADALANFKAFVQPLMAMGVVPHAVFETLIQKGVGDGLSRDQAVAVIQEQAKANNATIQTAAPPPPTRTAPPQLGDPDDDPSATHADTGLPDDEPYVDDDEEPAYADEYTGHHQQEEEGESYDGDEPAFSDEAEAIPAGPRGPSTPAPPPARQEALRRPAPARPAPPAPPDGGTKIQRGRFYDFSNSYEPSTAEPARPASPWARGGSTTPGGRPASAWGRSGEAATPPTPPPDTARDQRSRFAGQVDLRAAAEAKRAYNAGAKLARIAGDLHEQLALYFPPTNGKPGVVYQINGVSFEKVFDSEQKTYRDALKKFEEAQQKAEALGPGGEEVRSRAAQSVGLVKGYLEEIRQHKLKRLAPMSKPEELRMWQGFVSSRRSSRLTQTLDG